MFRQDTRPSPNLPILGCVCLEKRLEILFEMGTNGWMDRIGRVDSRHSPNASPLDVVVVVVSCTCMVWRLAWKINIKSNGEI